MKKFTKISFLLLIIGLYCGNLAFAQQKLAYVDPNIILLSMPQVKTADDAVVAFAKPLEVQAESKRKAFQQKEQILYQDIEANKLSPNQIRDRKTALQADYEAIGQYEQKATQDIQNKRQELYAPILASIKKAIETVARQNGVAMVIDASIGGIILHAEDVDNITPKVAQNMGVTLIQPEQN